MNRLSVEQFNQLLDDANVKARVKREVRFVAATSQLSDDDWTTLELLPIPDRTGNKGVLIIGLVDSFYITAYELSRGITSSTGRAQPIICDFCRTWQTGSRSGSILFSKDRSKKAVAFLCCADLQCSRHVRTLTSSARTSRAQLRENLNDEQRVKRLQLRLKEIADRLELAPLHVQEDM